MRSHNRLLPIQLATNPTLRRAALIAGVVFLFLGKVLPGRMEYQTIEIFDRNGNLKQAISRFRGDPKVKEIARLLEVGRQDSLDRPDTYFTSKWEVELAARYAGDVRADLPDNLAFTADIAFASSQQNAQSSSAIAQTSFASHRHEQQTVSNNGDWRDYWNERQRISSNRLESITNAAVKNPSISQLRLGDVYLGARSTPWFLLQLIFATTAYVGTLHVLRRERGITGIWNPRLARSRIELKCKHQLVLPRQCFTIKQSLSTRLRRFGSWTSFEIAAGSVCAMFMLI